MSILNELRAKGLVSKKEAYVPQETTTTANIATPSVPIGTYSDPRLTDPGDNEESVSGVNDFEQQQFNEQEDTCNEIRECIMSMKEAWEKMTGKKFTELYCPNCTPQDQSSGNVAQSSPHLNPNHNQGNQPQ